MLSDIAAARWVGLHPYHSSPFLSVVFKRVPIVCFWLSVEGVGICAATGSESAAPPDSGPPPSAIMQWLCRYRERALGRAPEGCSWEILFLYGGYTGGAQLWMHYSVTALPSLKTHTLRCFMSCKINIFKKRCIVHKVMDVLYSFWITHGDVTSSPISSFVDIRFSFKSTHKRRTWRMGATFIFGFHFFFAPGAGRILNNSHDLWYIIILLSTPHIFYFKLILWNSNKSSRTVYSIIL